MKRTDNRLKRHHIGVGFKLVALALPIIIIAFSLTTYISLETSKTISQELSLQTLDTELNLQKSNIENYLNE